MYAFLWKPIISCVTLPSVCLQFMADVIIIIVIRKGGGMKKFFSLSHRVQTGSGAYPAVFK